MLRLGCPTVGTARVAANRRGWKDRLLATVALALVATLPSAAGAGDHDARRPPVRGVLDLVASSDGSTRVVGWVSAPSQAPPTIRITIDGQTEPGFTPTGTRLDVGRVISGAENVWGWDLTVNREVQSSLCISAVVDGASRGLECWSNTRQTLLPAIGGGERLGANGRLIRYSVEVEAATGVHPEDIARDVDAVLGDDRSWAANGDASFKRVRPERADLRIVLATPATTDRLCFPFLTGGQLSCNKGDDLIVFNVNRWRGAVPHWTAPLAEYRAYLINHEVGHTLDFRHVGCPGRGMSAPLMMQQTKSLDGCLPNGWPYQSERTCLGESVTIVVVAGEPIVGTSGDDVILGSPEADHIDGGPGDDTICGLGGADVIRGGGGNDRLSGGGGRDELRGGTGRDSIWGNGAADTIRGGKGTDTCVGGPGTNDIAGC